ncbi:MAG: malto-oligosyltrehalose synthase [Planctomycetota bacterium]
MATTPAPSATYRLQLGPDFGFAAARDLVPYLADLGVSHLYTSPLVAARAGSRHGYDVVDPTQINPELGGEAGFVELAGTLASHGLRLLLDVVPNHLAASEENPWWQDVLSRGRSSPWARVFDIHWSGADRWGTFDQRLLLPVLGVPYGVALTENTIRADARGGAIVLRCHDRALPTDPSTWPSVLGDLEPTDARVPDRLASLSRHQLDAFVRAQPWQPVHWRLAGEIAGYRRFFDINDLVGVRVEEPAVFDATHALVLDLLQRGLVHGLRVDHIDGLRDPGAYLRRLAEAADFVVVEKILCGAERLPTGWPVAGTVGYEFGSAASGVFVDRLGREALALAWRRFTGDDEAYGDLEFRLKRKVLDELFSGEHARLASFLRRLAAASTAGLDLSPQALKEALATVTATLPVYRTYVTGPDLDASDRSWLASAMAEARRRRPDLEEPVFAFLERVLTLDGAADLAPEQREDRLQFVLSWQQLTGPVMAKGVEDTALYRFTPLLSLNAVGSEPDPEPARLSVDAFHAHNEHVQRHWPLTLLSTSTHDSKRSEDVRCRLHALADMPRTWARALVRCSRRNAKLRTRTDSGPVPDHAEEVMLYQTLLGAWPLDPAELAGFPDRVAEFTIKAAREAKHRTSWTRPDERHEAALRDFVAAILADDARAFLSTFGPLQRRIAQIGAWNSLALLTLKLGSPGVPDFYQGSELWQFRLVDPDNRAPVDFDKRRRLLAELSVGLPSPARLRELLHDFGDGRIKLYVTWRGLQLRRRLPDLLTAGDYVRLAAEGPRAAFVCAFLRRLRDKWVLCVVPSRIGQITSGRPPIGHAVWKGTSVVLPDGAPTDFCDVFTGQPLRAATGRLACGTLFRTLPAVLATATT